MARPLIIVSVVLVYLLGNLVAHASGYSMNISAFIWGLAALLLVTLSIHYANEYADYPTDALTSRTPSLVAVACSPEVKCHAHWRLR